VKCDPPKCARATRRNNVTVTAFRAEGQRGNAFRKCRSIASAPSYSTRSLIRRATLTTKSARQIPVAHHCRTVAARVLARRVANSTNFTRARATFRNVPDGKLMENVSRVHRWRSCGAWSTARQISTINNLWSTACYVLQTNNSINRLRLIILNGYCIIHMQIIIQISFVKSIKKSSDSCVDLYTELPFNIWGDAFSSKFSFFELTINTQRSEYSFRSRVGLTTFFEWFTVVFSWLYPIKFNRPDFRHFGGTYSLASRATLNGERADQSTSLVKYLSFHTGNTWYKKKAIKTIFRDKLAQRLKSRHGRSHTTF